MTTYSARNVIKLETSNKKANKKTPRYMQELSRRTEMFYILSGVFVAYMYTSVELIQLVRFMYSTVSNYTSTKT